MENHLKNCFIIVMAAFALFLQACSGNTSVTQTPAPTTASFNAATGVAWSNAGTTYNLSVHPTWTLATGDTIASQTIQYYSDGTCTTPSGGGVTLSTSATTDNFTAADLNTYSYKVTSTSSAGVVAVSACSASLAINSAACSDDRLTNTPYAGGTGTALDPFLICTAAQLNAIGPRAADLNKKFKLLSDISLAAYTGTQFNMIGTTGGTNFTGTFDGNGHTISNLTLSGYPDTAVGLFGTTSGFSVMIKDLTLTGVSVTASFAGGGSVGALIGIHSTGTVQNCRVTTGTVRQTAAIASQYVGGAIGRVSGGTVTAVSSGVSIAVNNRALATGGVIGQLAVASASTGLKFSGIINTSQTSTKTGGLVGDLVATTISDSSSTGSVGSAVGNGIGGLAGSTSGNTEIHTSFSSGNVTGNATSIGGLVGQLGSTAGHGIFDSYSQSTVTGSGSTADVGGIAGLISGGVPYIQNTYVTGVISFGTNVGAIVGSDPSNLATYNHNFWDADINPTLSAIASGGAGGTNTGETTANMKLPATFSGATWAGSEWNLTTSGVYLKLLWQP